MKLLFKLTKPAQRSGGDRYEAEVEGEDRPFVIYFPQAISRPGGVLQSHLAIAIASGKDLEMVSEG